MGNPLEKELPKAGWPSKKQAKKTEHEKRISRKQNNGNNFGVIANKARAVRWFRFRTSRPNSQQHVSGIYTTPPLVRC